MNPLTLKKIRRFKSIKRGYYAFIVISLMIFGSLFAELLVNKRALVVRHDGNWYFPIYGDIIPGGGSADGIFHNDTRYLSALRLLINGRRPLLLSSTVQDNNAILNVDLTNPDFIDNGVLALVRDTIAQVSDLDDMLTAVLPEDWPVERLERL